MYDFLGSKKISLEQMPAEIEDPLQYYKFSTQSLRKEDKINGT